MVTKAHRCNPETILDAVLTEYGDTRKGLSPAAPCYMGFLNAYFQMAQPGATDEQVEQAFNLVKKLVPEAQKREPFNFLEDWEEHQKNVPDCLARVKEAIIPCMETPSDRLKEEIDGALTAAEHLQRHLELHSRVLEIEKQAQGATTRLDKVITVEKFASTQHDNGLVLGYACGVDSMLEDVAGRVLNCLAEGA